MVSKTEDHGAEHTRRLADPLPCVQNFNSAKTTAVTENKQQKRAKRPQKSPQNKEKNHFFPRSYKTNPI